jgi:hypothetical protein
MNRIQERQSNVKFAVFLLALIVPGCATTIPQQSPLMEKVETVEISAYKLRLELNDITLRFSGIIEKAADEIAYQTDDPQVKQNALLWKINAIPALHRSAFISDPLAAFFDVWGLSIQMRQFFETGYGNELFREYQYVAIESSEQIESEIVEKIKVEENLVKGREVLYAWAEQNPIENLLFIRKSTFGLYGDLLEKGNGNIFSAIGTLAQGMQDVSFRLDTYAEHLPKRVLWEMEYLLGEKLIDEKIASIIDLTQAELDSLMTKALSEVNSQRVETIDDLRYERIALIEDLRKEIRVILDELDRVRSETLYGVDTITSEAIDKTSTNMREVIDHFFLRAIQLALGLLIAGSIIGYFVMRKIKKA